MTTTSFHEDKIISKDKKSVFGKIKQQGGKTKTF